MALTIVTPANINFISVKPDKSHSNVSNSYCRQLRIYPLTTVDGDVPINIKINVDSEMLIKSWILSSERGYDVMAHVKCCQYTTLAGRKSLSQLSIRLSCCY